MNELMIKYADIILNVCLKLKEGQPLFISSTSERLDFVRIVAEEAYKIGVKDIYFDIVDDYLKHDMLKYLEVDDLKNNSYFNREKWNEYAKKGAAFLMLSSEMPGLMADVDSDKQSKMTAYSLESRKDFNELRDKALVPWCIVSVPTLSWAKKVFPNSNTPLEDLWNKIFEICGIFKDNPKEELNNKLDILNKRKEKLNNLHIKKLIYTNSIGTNFSIELNDKSIWEAGRGKLANGEEILFNYPTEEIFTSPNCKSAEGIVYASKPLIYQDNIINNFWIKFENGKVVDYGAEEGLEVLKNLINICENSDYLGEVALVEYNSPISNSNILFYTTLFDENASCHLALGASFTECIENGINMTKEELINNNMNQCISHTDFMIGTSDLNIKGITFNNEEIEIFKEGNFVI